MKRGLKILYNITDTDRLANKYKDFDELMDNYAMEKDLRKRRLIRTVSALVFVALFSSAITWLLVKEDKEHTLNNEPAVKESIVPVIKDTLPIITEEEMIPVVALENDQESENIKKTQNQELRDKSSEIPLPEKDETILAKPELLESVLITRDAVPGVGMDSLYQYLRLRFNLPDSLLIKDTELNLEVSFKVLTNGSIDEVQFDQELPGAYVIYLRKVFIEMPAWIPALNKGDTISTEVVLPFTFTKQ